MGQAKQYFLHSHQSNSKMKAHQEEKNTLNSPPNKHYEWSFCIVLLEESLHPCLLLDASCSHCIGNTPWGEAGSCSQNSPCWASDSDHHQYLPATAKPQLTGPGKAASPRSDCNDRQSNSGQGTQGFHSPSFHNMQPHPHQLEVSHSTFRTVTSPKHKAGRRDGVGRGAAPSHSNVEQSCAFGTFGDTGLCSSLHTPWHLCAWYEHTLASTAGLSPGCANIQFSTISSTVTARQ